MRSVFLVGFMAAGKTVVGKQLGRELGLPFVDLDQEIEKRAGMSIPALFDRFGESGFRERERETLHSILGGAPAVVATGGGAAHSFDNLPRMRAAGLVIYLYAPLDVLLSRAGKGSGRPLLEQPAAEVEKRYRERQASYRQAHAVFDVSETAPDQTARNVATLYRRALKLPPGAPVQWVQLGERSYPIVVAEGVIDDVRTWIDALYRETPTWIGIVSDSEVRPLHGDRLVGAFAGLSASVHVVPSGEVSKSVDSFRKIVDELASAGLDRRSLVVAFGGGVVGDLAGFAAATLYRGIDCLQVPTTLLAMIDSSIGGKTGINLDAGKNLVGAFWQPRGVLADPFVLRTLPPRERRAGFGELLKYALLDGPELLAETERIAPAFADDAIPWRSDPAIGDLIRRCAAYKAWVVSIDERERSGLRALLNLGHTLGHAIEAAAGYGRLLHGEAVALGLVAACRVSARLGLCAPDLENRVKRVLECAGMDANVDPWLRPDVIGRIHVDKKRTGGEIGFICLEGVGEPLVRSIPLKELERLLRGN